LVEAEAMKKPAGLDEITKLQNDCQNVPVPQADLSKPWGGAPWWCVGDRQPLENRSPNAELSANVQQLLKECQSAIAEHAVIAHRIPLATLKQMDQQLNAAA
jgi:hypothetical protein